MSSSILDAAERHVPASYPTIQAAIDAAGTGDEVIIQPGVYYENINFLGKAITVRSTNPDDPTVVAATILDGAAPTDSYFASVVTFNSGEGNDSVLLGLTIQNGGGTYIVMSWEYQGPQWSHCGGGIVCYNLSQPTVTKCRIIDNIASHGGGFFAYGDPVNPADPSDPSVHIAPIISENLFESNQATSNIPLPAPNDDYPTLNHGDGGAIVCYQGVDATITNNEITNNQADDYGGGIHVRQWSNGLIQANRIYNNASTIGAGIHITYTSSPNVIANQIMSNTSTGAGGGIYIYYYSHALIDANTIINNTSYYGTIAYFWSSAPVIRNNYIIKNYGSGIYCNGDGLAQISHNTIVSAMQNGLSSAHGIVCTSGTNPRIEHNIIANNHCNGIQTYNDIPMYISYNDIWNNSCGNYGGTITDQTGINGNISADPSFLSPDDNNYHITLGSPCINAGNPMFTSSYATDFDGEKRRMGLFVDIGADEYLPIPPADITCDGSVDLLDYSLLSKDWLKAGDIPGDVNFDGVVDIIDLSVLTNYWGSY